MTAGTAIVAGGGIAGVTAALALAQSGVSTTVYERADAPEAFGAGIQLTPNATRILSRLGALDRLRRFATEPHSIRIMRGSDDAVLLRMRLDDAEKRWGAPYFAIHRADLLTTLVDVASETLDLQIQYRAQVSEITASATSVHVVLSGAKSRSEDEAEVLLGADGWRSGIRDFIQPSKRDQPVFSHQVAFRAAVDATDVDRRWRDPEISLHLGPHAHLVHYPLRGGSIVNLVAVVDSDWRGPDADDPWDGVADRPVLDRAFARWSGSTRKLLAAARFWRAWPLYRRPLIPTFAFGRIALVGDAAHAMEPFLAQGAAQAIEDAGALASAIQLTRNLPLALAAYSRGRAPRATRVQREASRQGRIYHMNGLAALARDVAMRAIGPERLAARYDWLYGA